MIPLLFDFRGETVLVFGGGRVGARKARRFAREARVVVVSPRFGDHDFGDAARVRAAPAPGAVADWVERAAPALVVAATDDAAVNDAAARAARTAGALVNRADRSGERGERGVVVPATVRDDPALVAVATGGESPALSRYLRERAETSFEGMGAMARLTGELRAALRGTDATASERRAVVRAVVRSSRVWKALRTVGTNRRHDTRVAVREVLADRSAAVGDVDIETALDAAFDAPDTDDGERARDPTNHDT